MSVIRQKGESQNRGNKKTKHAKFSEKANISYPLNRKHYRRNVLHIIQPIKLLTDVLQKETVLKNLGHFQENIHIKIILKENIKDKTLSVNCRPGTLLDWATNVFLGIAQNCSAVFFLIAPLNDFFYHFITTNFMITLATFVSINPLSAKRIKWSNTPKKFVDYWRLKGSDLMKILKAFINFF